MSKITAPQVMLDALGETGLADIEARFVEEYCVDLNHKAAMIRAGVPADRAAERGRIMLRKPEVMQAIDIRLAELSKHSVINAEYVRSKLKEVVERCMQAVPVMERVKGEDGKSELVPTGEFKFEAANAVKGLELLGKHLGMFTEHSVVTVEHELKQLPQSELDARIARLKEENDALTLEANTDGVYTVPVEVIPSNLEAGGEKEESVQPA